MFPTCTIEREGVLYHLIDLCPYIHLLDFLFVCQKIFEEQWKPEEAIYEQKKGSVSSVNQEEW